MGMEPDVQKVRCKTCQAVIRVPSHLWGTGQVRKCPKCQVPIVLRTALIPSSPTVTPPSTTSFPPPPTKKTFAPTISPPEFTVRPFATATAGILRKFGIASVVGFGSILLVAAIFFTSKWLLSRVPGATPEDPFETVGSEEKKSPDSKLPDSSIRQETVAGSDVLKFQDLGTIPVDTWPAVVVYIDNNRLISGHLNIATKERPAFNFSDDPV